MVAPVWLVLVNRGFAKVMTVVNGPTSAPPEPLKVYVPPVAGIPLAPKLAVKKPLIPKVDARVNASPLGPVRVTVPPSNPVSAGTGAGTIGPTVHPPGDSDLPGL